MIEIATVPDVVLETEQMLGIGLSLTLSGGGPRRFTPASIFAASDVGYWPGGYDPAAGRLFQDAAGVTQVTAAAQPVGRANELAGGAFASQATALSRPTLARAPKTGAKNLFNGSTQTATVFDVGSAIITADQGLGVTGLTLDRIERHSSVGESNRRRNNSGMLPSTVYTLSAHIRAGSSGALVYLRNLAVDSSLGGTSVFDPAAGIVVQTGAGFTASISPVDGFTGLWRCSVTGTTLSTVANNLLDIGVTRAGSLPVAGNIGDFVLAGDYQLQIGALTPYQRRASAFDITEAGVPSIWHLNNDGNDSLPATLPAGTYTAGWVDATGDVTFASGLSVTTTLDTLRGQNQADVLIINRALTSEEQARLTAYWQARYAA